MGCRWAANGLHLLPCAWQRGRSLSQTSCTSPRAAAARVVALSMGCPLARSCHLSHTFLVRNSLPSSDAVEMTHIYSPCPWSMDCLSNSQETRSVKITLPPHSSGWVPWYLLRNHSVGPPTPSWGTYSLLFKRSLKRRQLLSRPRHSIPPGRGKQL